MSDEDQDDKQFAPSQKRLDDARKRGEIVKSAEISAAASYAGLTLAFIMGGAAVFQHFGTAGMTILGQVDRLAPNFLISPVAPAAQIAQVYGAPSLGFLLVPGVAVLLVLMAQRAIVFAPEKLAMKWSRLSPISNAKQKFGLVGLVEFMKNTFRMLLVAVLLYSFLMFHTSEIVGSLHLEAAQAMQVLMSLTKDFLLFVLLITAVFGGLDYIWQHMQHTNRNRMSRKEMADEMKDSEGDPHVKMQRRQRGQEIATNRMLVDVETSDVVIVNPTHYAVALKWSRAKGGAPICVAKGMDDVAARIRAAAANAGVPLHSDPTTARAIFATVDIGQQILPAHYRAVAAAIRFAERMRKLANKVLVR